uniref:Uncharacterized membrane protein pNG3 n=1 Tax=African swine fever virus (strain Badajoz 1971 Vero-adapted) TaxID=10498 RepID=PNG3_ASFB7|nr:RecName: Full=Uncharacterized membrane protein pNG3 [African swine fever virus BA71V]
MFELSSILIRGGGGVLIVLILLLWIVDENCTDAKAMAYNINCTV